jgi:hypothetical protein
MTPLEVIAAAFVAVRLAELIAANAKDKRAKAAAKEARQQ